MLDLAKAANLGLAFALELAMLAAFAVWALGLPLPTAAGWALAVLLVVAAAVLWAIWAAPRSQRRLGGPALLAFKIVLFVLATLALLTGGAVPWAAAFAVLAAANLVLAGVWRQDKKAAPEAVPGRLNVCRRTD